MVNRRVVLLAGVTILRFDHLTELRVALDFLLLETRWRQHVRRGENFFPAQFADSGLVEFGLVPLNFLRLAQAHPRLHEPPPRVHIRAVNLARGFQQTHPFLLRNPGQQRPVAGNAFQQLGGRPQAFSQSSGAGCSVVTLGLGRHQSARKITDADGPGE